MPAAARHRQLRGRSVAFTRVDLPHSPLPLFITHLTYQLHLGHVRCAQVRALTDHVHALAPVEGPPPVLAGDFNTAPTPTRCASSAA